MSQKLQQKLRLPIEQCNISGYAADKKVMKILGITEQFHIRFPFIPHQFKLKCLVIHSLNSDLNMGSQFNNINEITPVHPIKIGHKKEQYMLWKNLHKTKLYRKTTQIGSIQQEISLDSYFNEAFKTITLLNNQLNHMSLNADKVNTSENTRQQKQLVRTTPYTPCKNIEIADTI